MKTRFMSYSIVSAAIVACGDASDPNDVRRWEEKVPAVSAWTEKAVFGWNRPITAANFDPAAEEPLGPGAEPIAGLTLRDLVTNPDVRIRGDKNACVKCHDWAAGADCRSFCERVPLLLAQPTSKGDGTDHSNAKPALLKKLVSEWRDNGCPP